MPWRATYRHYSYSWRSNAIASCDVITLCNSTQLKSSSFLPVAEFWTSSEFLQPVESSRVGSSAVITWKTTTKNQPVVTYLWWELLATYHLPLCGGTSMSVAYIVYWYSVMPAFSLLPPQSYSICQLLPGRPSFFILIAERFAADIVRAQPIAP